MAGLCLFVVLCLGELNKHLINKVLIYVNISGLFVERANCNVVPNVESLCSSIFQYKKDSNDGWIGEVKLNNIDIKRNIMLQVEITVKSTSDNVGI